MKRYRPRCGCDHIGFLLLGILLALAFVSPQAGRLSAMVMTTVRSVFG